MQVKVVYTGGLNTELDDTIIRALTEAGLEWYAQGQNIETRERDICFDWVSPRDLKVLEIVKNA